MYLTASWLTWCRSLTGRTNTSPSTTRADAYGAAHGTHRIEHLQIGRTRSLEAQSAALEALISQFSSEGRRVSRTFDSIRSVLNLTRLTSFPLGRMKSGSSRSKIILIIINVLIYAVELFVLTLSFWNSADMFHLVQSQFLNVLYIFSVTAFVLYGFGLYRTWRNTPIARKNPINVSRMRLTLIITTVVSVSFAVRVTVNACWHLIRRHWWHYPFEVVFYTIVELVPITLLLWLMLASGFRRITKPQSAFKPLIAQAGFEHTDDEMDYNSSQEEFEDEEPEEDTPGGLFD